MIQRLKKKKILKKIDGTCGEKKIEFKTTACVKIQLKCIHFIDHIKLRYIELHIKL